LGGLVRYGIVGTQLNDEMVFVQSRVALLFPQVRAIKESSVVLAKEIFDGFHGANGWGEDERGKKKNVTAENDEDCYLFGGGHCLTVLGRLER